MRPGCRLSSAAATTRAEARYSERMSAALAGTGFKVDSQRCQPPS